jgi:hypothetical protein
MASWHGDFSHGQTDRVYCIGLTNLGKIGSPIKMERRMMVVVVVVVVTFPGSEQMKP